ncbi:glycosyltransferase [Pedobacter gandavensis]|uniref:glycosyltransferase n=1 Tax=Pedobacter gandavensis TaxID=2679963 RepID=UPI0029303457|nr:glycosyltransferase [Pedobacter gandavensis]
MNILFLASLFPEESREVIKQNSKGAIANANDALQWSYVKGISSFTKNLKVICAPNIGAFPLKYKSLFFHGSGFINNSAFSGETISFFNLLGFKHFSRYLNVKKRLFKWNEETVGNKTIIIYDLHAPFLAAVSDLKKKNPEIVVCLIVPDLHGFTGNPQGVLYNLFGRIEKRILDRSLLSVDSYVLLSKHMNEHLPVGGKPCMVMEGIYNSEQGKKEGRIKSDQLKTIFYSGAIDERNGVIRLLTAFEAIPNENYRLILCGEGDGRNEVQSRAMKDPRIIYKGQIDREEVLMLQKVSTLLVNPRTPEGEFTKFSFPSKTMEYLASGVPTLMYRLEGIPDEYYTYSYVMDDISIQSLSDRIVNICEQPNEVLSLKGKIAQDFVLTNKTPKIQCGKLLDMLNKL